MAPDAFFSDSDLVSIKEEIDIGFVRLVDHLRRGGVVVLPADGLGTGLARLPTNAPKIHDYIQRAIARLNEIAAVRAAQ